MKFTFAAALITATSYATERDIVVFLEDSLPEPYHYEEPVPIHPES